MSELDVNDVVNDIVGEEEEKRDSIDEEDRIDEFGINAFQSMGYTGHLSDNAISVYKEFKRRKDKLQPGTLTAEGYAFISILGDMLDGESF